MRPISSLEFPEDVQRVYEKARRLEWITLIYVSSAAAFLYYTMGSSQAMRTSFFEDVISLVPAATFLICTSIARRKPSVDYPYGMHRATSIGHLVAALALCAMGIFLIAGAALKFFSGEKPTIAGFIVFDTVIWAGWPMLVALLYTGVPTAFLGRVKHKLAPQLHDKILYADAKMMKADWMAESATAVGVIGAGFGYHWLDPLAAAVVSLDILKDGASNLFVAVTDLIDRRPQTTDGSDWEHLPDQVRNLLLGTEWVAEAQVRMREEGHVFLGEAFVVPKSHTGDLVPKIVEAAERAKAIDWRVHEVVIMPVDRLPNDS